MKNLQKLSMSIKSDTISEPIKKVCLSQQAFFMCFQQF